MDNSSVGTFIGALYHQAPGMLVLLDADGNKISEIIEMSRMETPVGSLILNLVVHVPLNK